MKNPSISHAHKSSYTHTHFLSHTRGRQKEVHDQPLGYSILLMEVAAPVDQVDPMALPVHVPARPAPVAGTRFKRNVRSQIYPLLWAIPRDAGFWEKLLIGLVIATPPFPLAA